MKIALASDHAGYELKEGVRAFLENKGIACLDCGCGPGETVDYVDYGIRAMESMGSGECDRAILFCGTGLGMAIVANKFRGIRAAACWNLHTAEISRKHNDCNCLCLGGRVLELAEALGIVEAWLNARFEGGRHERRVDKIIDLEKKNFG
ncbi:MAG: ribose 5-phosphate isomerase B [Clostridiales bacterium]|nr:ribose 5-phosphate isomerase B [Clostridiales bacterium]